MTDELPAVKRLRLKLKAAKSLIRDLGVAVAQAEEALEEQSRNSQPMEAQSDHEDQHKLAAA